jgi:hypothetical protein
MTKYFKYVNLKHVKIVRISYRMGHRIPNQKASACISLFLYYKSDVITFPIKWKW